MKRRRLGVSLAKSLPPFRSDASCGWNRRFSACAAGTLRSRTRSKSSMCRTRFVCLTGSSAVLIIDHRNSARHNKFIMTDFIALIVLDGSRNAVTPECTKREIIMTDFITLNIFGTVFEVFSTILCSLSRVHRLLIEGEIAVPALAAHRDGRVRLGGVRGILTRARAHTATHTPQFIYFL